MTRWALALTLLLVACDGAVTVDDPVGSREIVTCEEYVTRANQQHHDGVLSLKSWVQGFKEHCPEAEERSGLPASGRTPPLR